MTKRLWCFLSQQTLPFATPTAHGFLMRLLKIGKVGHTSWTGLLARYLLDLSLLEYSMQWYSASLLAATALLVALQRAQLKNTGLKSDLLNLPDECMQHIGLSEESLCDCVVEVRKLLEVNPSDNKDKK
uniref:Cyclin C-terminal domain-containing protein n=1 Tax=Haptolina ericina TaxID=156174 RepID=A0A7S3B188_9EUKA|mmetsp:Transcript_45335/g.102353  ORF Transcript_45335/g.102353 Transcript_45335/m.102353 type:complete len:129 (+) Transcript_45335:808-1194(+)